MMRIPGEVLAQHIAVLGKTGSGKTSTAKLAIEQVVADGARVCILDPIKSDWWGLTSSADGKRPGLPFHILGGPRGHVPLHSGAGKAIADIVASGQLPLSIIDMAEFEPGGQARFFVDFAPALLRKMRGVVYLVIEEAHLFAPKERSGIGAENLSIHWAKTMATAGRSKGIRLVLVTQRTQALHNALLGSCDSLIAHRLTAPADQKPVLDWLKATTSKAVLEQVSASLASLKTGEGWICSGEAKLFTRERFPRITTYDNTATPTGDLDRQEVKTAAVDQEKLRAIIGDAVAQAKADDPVELRKVLAEKDRRIRELEKVTSGFSTSNEKPKPEVERIEVPVVSAEQLARIDAQVVTVRSTIERCGELLAAPMAALKAAQDDLVAALKTIRQPPLPLPATWGSSPRLAPAPVVQARASSAPKRTTPAAPAVDASVGNTGLRRMLIALAQRNGLSARQLGLRATMATGGGSFRTYLSEGRTKGWIIGDRARLEITAAGLEALGTFDPLPTGRALLEHWLGELGASGAARILGALADVYPRALSKEEIGAATNMEPGGGSFRTYMSKLRTLELIEGKGEIRASAEFFEE